MRAAHLDQDGNANYVREMRPDSLARRVSAANASLAKEERLEQPRGAKEHAMPKRGTMQLQGQWIMRRASVKPSAGAAEPHDKSNKLQRFWSRSNGSAAVAPLRNVFSSHHQIDTSDAGLQACFTAVDLDASGAISAAEMKRYVGRVYGPSKQAKKVLSSMMKAADEDGKR